MLKGILPSSSDVTHFDACMQLLCLTWLASPCWQTLTYVQLLACLKGIPVLAT
jgi:hypothetical protein